MNGENDFYCSSTADPFDLTSREQWELIKIVRNYKVIVLAITNLLAAVAGLITVYFSHSHSHCHRSTTIQSRSDRQSKAIRREIIECDKLNRTLRQRKHVQIGLVNSNWREKWKRNAQWRLWPHAHCSMYYCLLMAVNNSTRNVNVYLIT